MPSVGPRPRIPPAPALIDQLALLGTALNAYWDSTEDRDIALLFISQAAVEADHNETNFTREYVSDYLGRRLCGSDFREAVRTWLDEIHGELDGFGEILAAIEWACRRINDLTGISIDDIRRTIERKAGSEPMDFAYGRESLNHVATELRKLDRDGAGAAIWRFVWRKCDVLRSAWETNRPKPVERSAPPTAGSTATAGNVPIGTAAGPRPGRGGRRPLPDSDPKVNVYRRVLNVLAGGVKPQSLRGKLETDRDFMDLFRIVRTGKAPWKDLAKNARDFFRRGDRGDSLQTRVS